MQAHLLENSPRQSALLFRVEGLDCKNEVAALKREVGPLVGGEDWLTFDTAKGLMTVAPQQVATADDIIDRVAPTGMRASLVADGTSETLLYRVHGLDCKNEVGSDAGIEHVGRRGQARLRHRARYDDGCSSKPVRSRRDRGSRCSYWHARRAVVAAGRGIERGRAHSVGWSRVRLRRGGAGGPQPTDPDPHARSNRVSHSRHGLRRRDCGIEARVGPLVGENKLAFDLLNGRMSIDAMSDAALEARIEKAVARAGMRASRGAKAATAPQHRTKSAANGCNRG
jgi:Cd2+/Zn2+-exporting ATPase